MGIYFVPGLGHAEMSDKITTIKSFWVAFDKDKLWPEMARFLQKTDIEEFLNSEFYNQMREVFDSDVMEGVITQIPQLAVVSGITWQFILQPGLAGGIFNIKEEEISDVVRRVMVVDPRELEGHGEVSWDDDVRWVTKFYVIIIADEDENRQEVITGKYLKKAQSTDVPLKGPTRKCEPKAPTNSASELPKKTPQQGPVSTKNLKDLFS